jgi:hypothetical protein
LTASLNIAIGELKKDKKIKTKRHRNLEIKHVDKQVLPQMVVTGLFLSCIWGEMMEPMLSISKQQLSLAEF